LSTEAALATGMRSAGKVAARGSFFFVAHTSLLIVVLIGFAPTFYLRSRFGTSTLSPSLVLHGALLTAWFALAPVQAWLARSGRLTWHRILGTAAVVVAGTVVVSALIINTRLAVTLPPDDSMNVIVWGNYLTLPVFAGFVVAGIALRRRPDSHKRLMLLASISIVPPALGRLPLWPIFDAGIETAGNFAAGGLLLMIAVMVINDLMSQRRVHVATWIGIAALVVSAAVGIMLGFSQAGYDLLRALA
jgi:hypothetical protein